MRTASWRSVLAGASSGLGHGAHGAWCWYREGAEFTSENWSGIPFPAEVAMRLPGAWDVGHLRRLVLQERLFGLRDRTHELIVGDRSGARAGASADGSLVVVHAPEPFRLTLTLDASQWSITCHDLTSREPAPVRVSPVAEGLRIEQPRFTGDALYVLRRS